MRPLLLIYSFIVLLPVIVYAQDNRLNDLLKELDSLIENNESYILKREARIEMLNNRQQVLPPNTTSLYDVNMQLYNEYKSYKCDSAIAYLNANIEIAEYLNDSEKIYESKLLMAYLLEQSGLYKEAADLIESVDRKNLPDHFLQTYYNTCYNIYRAIDFYTQDSRLGKIYKAMARNYRDSLLSVIPENPENREGLTVWQTFYLDNNNYDQARNINDRLLSEIEIGTPEHAMTTYHRSLIHAAEEDHEKEKYYLALSAISDIRSAIKDHASLWMLAEILFKEGDINRAYNYIRFSWNDTQFYNARLRSLQTAGILSLIDQTYQMRMEDKNDKLRNLVILTSILVILLLSALSYIQRQIKKLSVARNDLQEANQQMKGLNNELKQTNHNLQVSNEDLSESNKIKEEYIARFIKLCSLYIDKLDAYRRMVNKKISAGQIQQLVQITRSEEALDEELQELYTNFDTAFLHLFPDFVNKFNELLADNERIKLKKGELLNTELRIFALIRLGIEDSSQIAEFLRYSVNTIYNYRAKVKNKSKVCRDDFEDLVKVIR